MSNRVVGFAPGGCIALVPSKWQELSPFLSHCVDGDDLFGFAYALQIGDAIWVIHAFQKKSKTGIKTPKPDIDLIKERLKRLKEFLR
jgi:phage-related protein